MKRIAHGCAFLLLQLPPGLVSFAVTAAAIPGSLMVKTAHSRIGSLAMSSSPSSSLPWDAQKQNDKTCRPQIIRVLALHGSEGTADTFVETTLGIWRQNFEEDSDNNNNENSSAVDLQITALQAHVQRGDGFAWWDLPPGVRSSTATAFDGFDTSRRTVLDALLMDPPFDLVVGHSQGAILVAALLALGEISSPHPRLGYILNGVAWPNPYTDQLEALRVNAPQPRVLIIVGDRDQINRPEQAARVAAALRKAGCFVTTLPHPGGHAVPVNRDETWEAIRTWLSPSNTTSNGL